MSEEFSLRNHAMQTWLISVAIGSMIVASVFPPAFWLCGVGAAGLVVGILSNSARTGQLYSWQTEGSLSWFEGWAAGSGAILIVMPLLVVFVRASLQK